MDPGSFHLLSVGLTARTAPSRLVFFTLREPSRLMAWSPSSSPTAPTDPHWIVQLRFPLTTQTQRFQSNQFPFQSGLPSIRISLLLFLGDRWGPGTLCFNACTWTHLSSCYKIQRNCGEGQGPCWVLSLAHRDAGAGGCLVFTLLLYPPVSGQPEPR